MLQVSIIVGTLLPLTLAAIENESLRRAEFKKQLDRQMFWLSDIDLLTLKECLKAHGVENDFHVVNYFVGGVNKLTIQLVPENPENKTITVGLIQIAGGWKLWNSKTVQELKYWSLMDKTNR